MAIAPTREKNEPKQPSLASPDSSCTSQSIVLPGPAMNPSMLIAAKYCVATTVPVKHAGEATPRGVASWSAAVRGERDIERVITEPLDAQEVLANVSAWRLMRGSRLTVHVA
jgi:hypothetical protein